MAEINRIIFHLDVNSAYLSWEAAYRLQHGEKIDLNDCMTVRFKIENPDESIIVIIVDRIIFKDLEKLEGNKMLLFRYQRAMFASQGELLMNNPAIMVKLLLPTVIFFIVNFFIGQIVGKLLRLSYKDTVAFNFTTLARNSPIALAIAVASFPEAPLIALALVIGPLIELPIWLQYLKYY